MILLVVSVSLIWIFSSVKTFGLIEKRYDNRNAVGELKEDITTGRGELVETELLAFYNHPFIGIGEGKGKDYLEETIGCGLDTHK